MLNPLSNKILATCLYAMLDLIKCSKMFVGTIRKNSVFILNKNRGK